MAYHNQNRQNRKFRQESDKINKQLNEWTEPDDLDGDPEQIIKIACANLAVIEAYYQF